MSNFSLLPKQLSSLPKAYTTCAGAWIDLPCCLLLRDLLTWPRRWGGSIEHLRWVRLLRLELWYVLKRLESGAAGALDRARASCQVSKRTNTAELIYSTSREFWLPQSLWKLSIYWFIDMSEQPLARRGSRVNSFFSWLDSETRSLLLLALPRL